MIGYRLDGHVGHLTLARPDKRNALTPDMLRDLRTRAAAAPGSGVRSLLLSGLGPVFCSGFDLELCRDALDGSAMRDLLRALSDAIATLRSLPVPVVVAAHGAAVAGGCALIGGADLAVTNRDAKLGYPVVRLGVSPAVSAPFIRQSVPDGAARALMLDPQLISGAEALRMGLVHECLDRADDVLPRAIELAGALASKPPGALSATRAWIAEIENLTDSPVRALAASLSLAGSDEERTRIAAAFTGR